MSTLSTLAVFVLVFLGGWLLRGAVGSAWRSTRRPHRFSDARHKWVQIDGEAHAFTDGELAEAAGRARRLTPGRVLWRGRLLWAAAVAVLLVLACAGCGRKEAALTTGSVKSSPEVRNALPGFAGDTAYAVVRRDALPALHDNFKQVLNQRGLVKWDHRYDCNHFAALYVAVAQTDYAVAAWHSDTKAQTLALAEVWYRPGAGASGHAIVAALTDAGLVFIEPQTGRELTLTAQERGTIYLCKW